MRQSIFTIVLLPLIAMSLVGCGGDDPPPTLDEIFKQERDLPKLFFTAITQKRVIAPASKGFFTDLETKEVCWPALECQNPACPGKGPNGEPFLFISPDLPVVGGKPDGSAVMGNPDPRTVPGTSGLCPQCLKARNRNTETNEMKQKYINWVRHHELPESAKRRKELEEVRKKRHEFEKNAT